MKKISKILKQALRKNAQELIKREKEFVFEGSWCDKYQKHLKENPSSTSQPSIITEQQSCNSYQSRQANDWSAIGPSDACAAGGVAVKCSNIDPNYTGTLADLCQNGTLPGTNCQPYSSKIKLFPPSVPMTPPTQNNCEGGWTAVPGDYMLSHGGQGQGAGPNAWIPYLIVESDNFVTTCQGPRIGHHACSWSNAGCTDANAINYSPTYSAPCDQDPTYPANCIGGTTGPDCCCTYPGPGCTDPVADNYTVGVSPDDGSCEYSGCTDPTATNYSFGGNPFPAVTPQLTGPGPYDPTGNGGTAIDDGSCQYPPPITFDCIQGLCEENIVGTGQFVDLDTCLESQVCDRWECRQVQAPTPMEEQLIGLDPILTYDDLDDPIGTTGGPGGPGGPSTGYPMTTDCFQCDPDQYDPVSKTWDPNCIYFSEQECTDECNPPGCTDPAAINYDPNAVVDDGSCEYPNCSNTDFSTYTGQYAQFIIDAYNMGVQNNQQYGILDGNALFCTEVCAFGQNTTFPCDCCGPLHCEDIVDGDIVPFGCWSCLREQGGPCVQNQGWNQFQTSAGVNYYSNEPDCVAAAPVNCPAPPSCKNDPTFCSTNPYLTPGGPCWICHMYTECMPVYDYLQYGSGPQGSVGTQTFMMNWLTKVGNVFQTPQGSDLYCSEQDCMNATGCSAYSGYSPIPKKADPNLDTELPIDDFSADIAQAIGEPIEEPEKRIQEGVQIKGKLLNSSRMTKLAGIKRKK